MSRMKKYVGIAVLVGIVAALGISSVAAAQTSASTPTPTAPSAPTQQAAPPAGFGLRGLHSQAALDAAAKALGMTADKLSAQLWGGKTLSDLATAKGVDIATVKVAVDAAQVTETKTAIQQAVTDGTMTQAKADWLTQGLDKGYWGPGAGAGALGDFGFGMGPGMGGPGGGHGGLRGFGGALGAPLSNTAPNSSATPSNSN